jgi:hypothetical protein
MDEFIDNSKREFLLHLGSWAQGGHPGQQRWRAAHEKLLLEMTNAEIADSAAAHPTGPLRLTRALAPKMIVRGYGRSSISSGWGRLRKAWADKTRREAPRRAPKRPFSGGVWSAAQWPDTCTFAPGQGRCRPATSRL